MINVLVIDDHKIVVEGIRSLFEQEDGIRVVRGILNGKDSFDILKTTKVDVALVDIELPDINGIELTKKIRDQFPKVKVIMMSMFDDKLLIENSIKAGANGYLLKETGKREMLKAINRVYSGKSYISDKANDKLLERIASRSSSKSHYLMDYVTQREQEIILLILEEKTNAEIAKELFISEDTVKTHRKNIMKKLEVKNVVGLVILAMKHFH